MKIVTTDAAESISFEITQRDISSCEAKRKDPGKCIIAQGIRHSLPQVVNVMVCASVTILTVCKSEKTLKLRYRTSAELRNGLNKWDVGMDWDLPPGEYTLLPPKPKQRGAVKSRKSKSYQATGRCKGIPLNPRRIAIIESRLESYPQR